ncbi:Cytochrome P450 monooxygenase [Fulvia fulva]|uniref:Cytochrome P450 monooxygenase n=1 Tax=Passalora fulva TaxID=5499 RepID=A0A9Q8USE7_PASFU|nr:Cytochrome P450 monooxygenase [Fulvia fulva]KAK4617549.1 Cytochrome P450 monooxygenase [Fulvia fulva]KAK4618641.1 Cytochrome P450 monooxygenase [Fulvia fulva]UJO20723.1 Cytochrome P450 monooxygenase [Fulvia fulva]WPV18385.1 Cytochrome P450 monooxygenase [Fulvia fulva]WPV33364.1 Cytochrome P450 monooxygenase [Fulvia fulva]
MLEETILSVLRRQDWAAWLFPILLTYLLFVLSRAIYDAFFGPLSIYPGPWWRAISNIPEALTLLRGEEGKVYLALHETYGPVVRVASTKLSYTGQDAFRDIYGAKANLPKDFFFYGKPASGFSPIVSAAKDEHSRQRKVLAQPFSARNLRELEPRLKSWAQRLRSKLEEEAEAGKSCDMVEYYNCTTFDIMGDLCFSEDLGMLKNGEYASWLRAAFESIKTASRFIAIKTCGKPFGWLVDLLLQILPQARGKHENEHRESSTARMRRRLACEPGEPDLWTRILEKSPDGLAEGEHYANSGFFLFAGSETTATALSGITFYLLKNPEYLAKLVEEIRSTYSKFDDMSLESLVRMKFLHCVIQEGLRMLPPVPSMLARKVPREGATIAGKRVSPGTTVGFHHLSAYRNPKYWQDGSEFRPERWMGDSKYKNDHLGVLEPFSIGSHDCLGKALAWHEIRLILATVLLHFDLSLCAVSNNWSDLKIYGIWEKKPLVVQIQRANVEQSRSLL